MPKTKIQFEDIRVQDVEQGKIVNELLSASDQDRIVKQIDGEYDLCFKATQAKRLVNLARLRLYNNQMRDPDTFGDPLMFTIFNTILASLWDDRLGTNWKGRGGQGDEDIEENLNALSEFDYDVMHKAELDYDWDWDTLFFGRGLVLIMDFD